MSKIVGAAVIAALISTPAIGQSVESVPLAATVESPAPITTAPILPARLETELPANTEILLSMNSEITSTTHRAGETFTLSTATDTRIGDLVVIPRGTRAVGEITWRTGRGAFGKSGKMRISLRYLDLDGTRIPIEGDYYQAGEGNTLATVGGIIAIGIFAGFITGSRARIPTGRELAARTAIAVPFQAGEDRVRLAPGFGSLLDTWRTAQASTPEGACRTQAQSRGGSSERVAERTHECLERAQPGTH
jgi:hypothetical protein